MGAVIRLYRGRGPLLFLAAGLCLLGALRVFVPPKGVLDVVFSVMPLLGMIGILVAMLLTFTVPGRLPRREPVTVSAPVAGRWLGMNSPVEKVPSHGVRVYGQAYAIDLVYDPNDQERPAFGTGAAMRDPREYPAFGQPVWAMVDGVVVRAVGGLRDHRARSSWLSVIYMMVEGSVRELGGPRFIVGNHVVIRTDDGVYALVAHLRNRSLLVRVGDRVSAGQMIAECGNSGNSSEPHVHAQLMDRASLWTAQGIPFVFADVCIEGHAESHDALPGGDQHMVADPSLRT